MVYQEETHVSDREKRALFARVEAGHQHEQLWRVTNAFIDPGRKLNQLIIIGHGKQRPAKSKIIKGDSSTVWHPCSHQSKADTHVRGRMIVCCKQCVTLRFDMLVKGSLPRVDQSITSVAQRPWRFVFLPFLVGGARGLRGQMVWKEGRLKLKYDTGGIKQRDGLTETSTYLSGLFLAKRMPSTDVTKRRMFKTQC